MPSDDHASDRRLEPVNGFEPDYLNGRDRWHPGLFAEPHVDRAINGVGFQACDPVRRMMRTRTDSTLTDECLVSRAACQP